VFAELVEEVEDVVGIAVVDWLDGGVVVVVGALEAVLLELVIVTLEGVCVDDIEVERLDDEADVGEIEPGVVPVDDKSELGLEAVVEMEDEDDEL
jgi:hypothetical protein